MSKAETGVGRNGLEIAVIGMAGRFPGAETIEQFWRNLCGGVESISFFTDEEMLAAGADPESLKNPNLVRAGGVLQGIELFDAGFFSYSPREAEIIDPQQRLFLECAWEALEHAGHGPATCREPVGVFAGTGTSGYVINIYSNFDSAADPFQIANGNEKDYLATRVSYKLNLKGPSVTVQTACSTSLVATHLGCQSLLSGACDMALVGGVTVSATQKTGYIYQEGGILSPDGHVRTFDVRARGCVGGSGVGVVVLRRLEEALADGDTIYAVIKGSAINNDGAEKVGFTAPSVEGQAAVIRAALAMSDVEPEMVSYVEAHGTATPLGDPIEVAGLTQAFGERTTRKGFCALGSVKTNVGHLDAAAGVAGLIKTTLALKHRRIPPSLNFEEGNPQIDFAGSPFYVNAALSEWGSAGTRYAGVSSFGIGGTNCHVVLEEAPPEPPPSESRPWQLLLLSARTKTALEELSARLADALRREPAPHLPDVAYTLQAGRGRLAHRCALVCRTAAEAASALESRGAGHVLTGFQESQEAPVVFMFPGQGAQRVNMGLELYRSEPTFRGHVDLCSDILKPHVGLDLRGVLYPPRRTEEAEAALRQTQLAQAALFVVESGLAALWEEWGVRPRAMIGHSLGEYVAAYRAGVFALEDALALVATRGRLMQGLAPGAMLAVPLPEQEVRALLGEDPRLSLAAVNGPSLCVVSGPRAATEGLARQLAARGLNCRPLHTSHAFHSRMMEPALKPFEEAVRGLRLSPPRIPYVSNVTGTWVTRDEARDPGYWARHLRKTVRFGDGLGELLKEPNTILLELGPGDTLSALGARHPAKSEGHVFVPALHEAGAAGEDRSEARSSLRALGRLWLAGAALDWNGFYARERRRRIPLPTYPFERRRYWVERRRDVAGLARHARGEARLAMDERFFAPVWRQTVAPALLEAEPTDARGSRWLLFLDACGVGRRMAEQLQREGCAVVTVEPGAGFARAGEREFRLDPSRRDDYGTLFKELRAASLVPDSIVHLWALAPEDGRGSEAERVEGAQERGLFSLLWLAQALGEEMLEEALAAKAPARRIAVVSSGLHMASGDARSCPERATLLGPCRVIPQEYPNLTCRSIDLGLDAHATQDPQELAAQLLAELKAESPDRVVAYRHGERWVPHFEPVPLKGREGRPPRLRERGVYLITGGLGGVGLEAAAYLARTARARLVLLGRSEFPEKEDWAEWLRARGDEDIVGRKIKRLQAVEALGAEVLTLKADVASEGQLRSAVEHATRRFGRVNGVIHAAGVPPGSIIQRSTRGTAAGVIAPKLRGTLAIADVFRDSGLDFLLLCSSIRSLTGGAGAAVYCAANAFLDAFARSNRVGGGTFVTAVNWDGWLDTGMSLRGAARAEAGPGGAGGMTASEGVEALHRILFSSLPQVVVSTREPAAAIEQEDALTAAEALKGLEDEPAAAAAAHPRPELETPYVAPRSPAEQALADIWQSLLGIDRIGVHDNFFDLGGDSIVSIQIIGKARRAGLRLTPRQIFEHQTIAELAAVSSGAGAQAEQGLVTGPAPLTPVQRWFFEQRLPAPHHFNQAVLLRTRTRLDYDLLKRAVGELLLQHDALRFRFAPDGGGWRQAGSEEADAPCERFDLSDLPAERQAAAVEALAADAQERLDLTAGPLLRMALVELGAGRGARLLVVIHHLVVDALSWHILLEDLQCAYGQLARGERVELPPKTTSFKQWAERLQEHAQSDALEEEWAFWLADARRNVRPLPLDYSGGENVAASARDVTVWLSAEETLALTQDFTRRQHAQVNEALLAALLESFAGWHGGDSLLVDLEGHGREPIFEGVDLSRTVGWFTNIYPVLLSREAGDDPTAVLGRVREQLRRVPEGGLGYGLLRYLREDAETRGRMSAMPRAEVSFLYLGQFDHALPGSSFFEPAEESSGPHRDPRGRRSHLFEVVARITDGRLRLTCIYSANLHRAATVERLASDFMRTLRAFAAADPPLAARDFSAFDWSREEFDDFLLKINDAVK